MNKFSVGLETELSGEHQPHMGDAWARSPALCTRTQVYILPKASSHRTVLRALVAAVLVQ